MDFPTKCPYCGKDITRNKQYAQAENHYVVEIHTCVHCKKPIFLIYKCVQITFPVEETINELIHYYPSAPSTDLPKSINELSPKGYKIFEDTLYAKSLGIETILGAGIRMALEWVVWDYLIKIKGKTEAELKPLTLSKRIQLIDSNQMYTTICANLIRKIGNDSVHIIQMTDFSVDEGIELFEIFCGLIDNEIKIKNAQEKLESYQQTAK